MIQEIAASQWQETHRNLLSAGYVRFEFLTAAHLTENNFEIYSRVSTADLADFVLVKTNISDSVETLIEIYPAAKFHEQETHQMFGITFENHPRMEKAFETDFGGYPLRRDFALVTRQSTNWPGAVEPDEKAKRRPSLPPGVHESWSS
jgi:NADH-quinone oxidoreductase subunit C